MSYLISMFIDNELQLDEKVEFLKKIRKDDQLYEESIELLEQEKMLRSEIFSSIPMPAVETASAVRRRRKEKRKWFNFPCLQPLAYLSSAGAIALAVALLVIHLHATPITAVPYRFVLYKPHVKGVSISGTFTNWRTLPMKKVGKTGYWEIELKVPKGEQRYSFILKKGKRIADPTVLAKERDDFGGENSILYMSV